MTDTEDGCCVRCEALTPNPAVCDDCMIEGLSPEHRVSHKLLDAKLDNITRKLEELQALVRGDADGTS